MDKLAIEDGGAVSVRGEKVDQHDDLHLVVEGEPPGKEEVCEGLHGGEECKHNPVHHPLDILFDVLGPDRLVAGIGRVEGTQAQGDDPGEQVRDHCEISSHRLGCLSR